MSKPRVLIGGAGFGGLSAAALLGQAGWDVTVLEKNEQPGGRASVFREAGFTFDMGPSWYLMPDVFERYFAEFGKKPTDFFELTRLDPAYRIFFDQRHVVDVPATVADTLRLFEHYEPGASDALKKYLAQAQYQYDVSMREFIYRDYQSITDFFNKKLLLEGAQLRVFENLDRFVKRFFKNPFLQKIVLYNIVFLGGRPKNTPALYSIMAHIDFNLGVWYPHGGLGSVVQGLVKLCESHGVKFRYQIPVEKILVEGGKAVGVRTQAGELRSDAVLMNADYHHVETKLLDREFQSYPESYWKRKTIAPSGFIIFLGLDKRIEKLRHHNLFLDEDWTRHFDAIFDDPGWPEDPSYYICCPTQTDASLAPEGGEVLFLLVPVASGLDDNDATRQSFAAKIIKHVEGLLGQDIQESIIVKKIFAQRDFSQMYNAYRGSALGLSHTLLQSALFRPSHRSKKVENLFFTGQYTHPGIGVPMALISSQIVCKDMVASLG